MMALAAMNVPDEFDSREQWKNCTVISKVRDQSACGSCWAFGSTESFEDRRCVATGEDVEFSSLDTAGCCKGLLCGMSNGCGGGQPGSALHWMCRTGVVTGGDYADDDTPGGGCKPYEFPPCAHHVPPSGSYKKCKPEGTFSVTCKKTCTNARMQPAKSYRADKTKCSHAFSAGTVAEIQKAILTGGPLAVAFSVYSDFPTYKKGVYSHQTGSLLGGHAVEMTGWGTENGTPYWWIKNSWNSSWGDGGFFKIRRGTNECGIESMANGVRFDAKSED
jgi:cathepsin B